MPIGPADRGEVAIVAGRTCRGTAGIDSRPWVAPAYTCRHVATGASPIADVGLSKLGPYQGPPTCASPHRGRSCSRRSTDC